VFYKVILPGIVQGNVAFVPRDPFAVVSGLRWRHLFVQSFTHNNRIRNVIPAIVVAQHFKLGLRQFFSGSTHSIVNVVFVSISISAIAIMAFLE
jgi:hypothetical protein